MEPRNKEVIRVLNGLLMAELTAINQYFVHYKICQNWGYERLSDRFKEASFSEMKDAEEITERILHLGGLPNLQRIGTFQVGETIPEQLRLSLELERSAVEALSQAVVVCEREGDPATGTMLRAMALEEDEHLSWVEAQLEQISQIGEANYLTLQVKS